jgi:hypothetical protein
MRVAYQCEVAGYDSIEAMIKASELAMTKFMEHAEKESSGQWSPMESHAATYLGTYVKIAATIANLIHPKRKAVEHITVDQTDGMTPQQKLDAMKQAVLMLELKIKQDESGSV